MRSIFGWSYPPGCSGPPDYDDYPCEICGELPDNCICPECPVCGAVGDPQCYKVRPKGYSHLGDHHGLVRSEVQKFNLECNEREWEEAAKAERAHEDAMYEEWLKDQEDPCPGPTILD